MHGDTESETLNNIRIALENVKLLYASLLKKQFSLTNNITIKKMQSIIIKTLLFMLINSEPPFLLFTIANYSV